jgi:hypothetical protein
MERYKIVHLSKELADLALQIDSQEFPGWRDHPLTGLLVERLYQISHTGAHQDASFALLLEGRPALMAQATQEKGKLSWFDMPSNFAFCKGLDSIQAGRVMTRALRHLESSGFESAWISKGVLPPPEPNAVDRICLEREAKMIMSAHAVADLTYDVDFLRRDVRESSRSLLNWGERNLDIRIINSGCVDEGLLNLYPEFHARISGSVKHGREYWDAFFEGVRSGFGEMVLGFYQESLVSALLVMDQGDCAYYISAVNDRNRFDKPLGHWPLFLSLLRAKERGMRRYHVGEFYSGAEGISEKQKKIAYFKRGFTSGLVYCPSWRIVFSS